MSTGKSYDRSVRNRHFVFVESFAAARQESEEKPKTSSDAQTAVLPPFKEWREKQMEKYGKESSVVEGKTGHQRKPIRRKLNYSSSKCGAKILASNKEVRHKTAVLNEKADEYMLNPCRIRTWFIIELCDTVEATEIDLANYELYSSSPKRLSVFWSEVYPTLVWHDLGTFEAKDQRTMQTFALNKKNLGKFIKVVIYNHHGKEHYCPLSVIRVLGYSMVQEFEATEDANINPEPLSHFESKAKDEKNESFTESQDTLQGKGTSEYKNTQVSNSSFSPKMCSLYLMYCSNSSAKISKNMCYISRACTFLEIVIKHLNIICYEGICLKEIKTLDVFVKNDSENKVSYLPTSNETHLSNKYGKTKKVTKFENLLVSPTRCNKKLYSRKVDCNTNPRQIKNTDSSSTALRGNASKAQTSTLLKVSQETYVNSTAQRRENESMENSKRNSAETKYKKCICKSRGEIKSVDKDLTFDKAIGQDLFDAEYSVESAGLIEKESVLMKLASRIKASEVELNLINAYLQQLSQSYREQMEGMHRMFHQTIKAIDIASEKASAIDDKQQKELNSLEGKMDSLNLKVEYLTNGQSDLLIRVVELHVFFLLLEIIIISTIFTILLNILQRKSTLHEKKKKLGFLKEYLKDYCTRNKLPTDNLY